jgi:uncharacterized 2Fe-2S/4Fe-4S cluster protein (DUF4445 family)
MPEHHTDESSHIRIDFEPLGRRIEMGRGDTLLDAARQAGVRLFSFCGGVGLCDGCKVRVMEGSLSQPTEAEKQGLSSEELDQGYRLACQALPKTNVKVHVPPESMSIGQRLQLEGQSIEVGLDPTVIAVDLDIRPPNLEDLRSDVERLEEAVVDEGLEPVRLSLPVMKIIPDRLREQDWRVRLVLRGQEVVAALPAGSELLGLAIDVGTTKLAAYLLDLSTGRTLAKAGAMNPQVSYGEDVVSRIAYANEHPQGLGKLQRHLVEALNELLHGLCQQAGQSCEQVVEAVVVGNTAMHHLFAGLPVQQLGVSPYVPCVSRRLEIPANEIGLELAAGANVYMPPVIAGYVGADHVAMLLAADVLASDQNVLALDIGTNTEISLASDGRLLCCSCASGPAFEGAHIHDGMRASPGAVERVRLIEDEVRVLTVENEPPVGICGSGILDAVSVLLEDGALDRRGRLLEDHPRVSVVDGTLHYALVPPDDSGHGRTVMVMAKDVREVQLAKAAICAGVEILLDEAGVDAAELNEVIVAGAFGTYLDLASALRVGMFPNLPLGRFRQVGNAAGAGARQMLVSARRRVEAERLARKVNYIELTTHPRFTDVFVEALTFPLEEPQVIRR